MTVAALSYQVGNQKVTLTPNSSYKKGETVTNIALKWLGDSQEAIFRAGKIIELNAKLMNEALVSSGRLPSDSLKGIAKGAATMWHGTGPFRLPSLWKDASEAVSHWRSGTVSPVEGGMKRQMAKLINAVCEAVSMSMISLSMLFSSFIRTSPFCKPINLVGDLTSWTADFTSCSMSVEELGAARKALECSQGASETFQQGLLEVQRRNLLSVAKEVCGATSAAFGLVSLATGFVMAPAALLSLSLTGTLFAVWGTIYKKTMENECDFFSEKNVQLIQ